MNELDTFEAPDVDQLTTFKTDELTALCPFEFGGPDYYTLVIRYEADKLVVESKSLKKRLESYRGKEISAEALAGLIHRTVEATIEPQRLYVRLEQARRGGIEETVEVGEYDLRR